MFTLTIAGENFTLPSFDNIAVWHSQRFSYSIVFIHFGRQTTDDTQYFHESIN